MLLHFVTTNKHKVNEAKAILKRYGIEVDQINTEYDESADTVQEIAKQGADECQKKFKVPIIVEDTGAYLDAYDNFPGTKAKRVFEEIGYDGLFKKVENKSRGVKFISAIGYCEPGKKPIVFEGEMHGTITNEVMCKEKDVLPYERIIIPDGFRRTISELGFEIKNEISHRRKSFEALGKFLKVASKKPENKTAGSP